MLWTEEARITARLDEAEAQKKEAENEAAMFKLKNQNFDSEREEMISNAKEVSESFRKDLMQKAREEIDGIQARWHETVENKRLLPMTLDNGRPKRFLP